MIKQSKIEIEIYFSHQSQVVMADVEYEYQPREKQAHYSPDIRAQVDIVSLKYCGFDIYALFNSDMRDALRINLLELNEQEPDEREIDDFDFDKLWARAA